MSVDVTTDEIALEVLAGLGKNKLGQVTSLGTPTTLVGTRVIKGSNLQAILKVLDEQEDWDSAD